MIVQYLFLLRKITMRIHSILKSKSILMLLLVINIFTFIDLAFAQKTDNSNTKKLYIASIKATDVPVSFANRVRSNLMLSIFENYGDKYRAGQCRDIGRHWLHRRCLRPDSGAGSSLFDTGCS